ncbi:glycoside hydrolase family 37 protein [Saccharata proteae CBS 121410]|uniref:Trehalase n=1 Tax=Saccharata proteae CBS 121410 TaxID=1314787 RepID=A0A9P4HV88_9PEZI|nr:glycoside hydrolase family 37 protein [Saccharata proteae CBS 121410]
MARLLFSAAATAVLLVSLGPFEQAAALYVNGNVTAPCDSPLYCQGEILQAIELAQPFSDSKTFVDLPTIRPLPSVLAAYAALPKPLTNNTALQTFLAQNFGLAGSELTPVPSSSLTTNATALLSRIAAPPIRQFVQKVIAIWPDLTRRYTGSGSGNCSACVDSFIPLNRTFVVAGGRFREPYYWDSFWIVEGLLRTRGSFTHIAENIVDNFLDLVRLFDFVPNGARLYYLNRSQPPLLAQMVRTYVEYTGNATVLERALPLLEREYEFWTRNRSVEVVGRDGRTYTLNRYDVRNTQPRPESYLEDYQTVNNASYYSADGTIYPGTDLTPQEKATLYSNLAAGAETGWDYSSRWIANPADAAADVYFPLRSLNTRNIVPVDLNSILYGNEVAMADFYNRTGDDVASGKWAERAARRSEAMYALMWNESFYGYFDYNISSAAQNVFVVADADASAMETTGSDAPEGYMLSFTPAQYYPFWTGAAHESLKCNPLAVRKAYAHVEALLDRFPGGLGATDLATGEQWDQPNAWPPLQYILIKGLLNTPATFGTEDPEYKWTQDMALKIAQRYLDSAFCTWRSTGGSTDEFPKLQGTNTDGIMFEKYSDANINVAGGGGEYSVVEGFGWSNGVLIWAADVFGDRLEVPNCGNITGATVNPDKKKRQSKKAKRGAMEVSEVDRAWVKDHRRGR